MARPSSFSQQQELERLEQQITLTLQEIDANFSRAHRILTSRILPTIQQYGAHSDAVWEGAKFWKQFFEASANVSLSGYEEQQNDEETADETVEGDDTVTAVGAERTTSRESGRSGAGEGDDASLLTTPPSRKGESKEAMRTPKQEESTTFADYSSPYEALRQEMGMNGAGTGNAQPTTPGRPMATSPTKPSPFIHSAARQQSTAQRRHQDTNPLLHRTLDKTYRVQATPHRGPARPPTNNPNPASAASSALQQPASANPALDSSPFSPGVAAPTFTTQLLGSPSRRRQHAQQQRQQAQQQAAAPRTPGVSVYKTQGARTPAAGGGGGGAASARKTLFASGKKEAAAADEIRVDWDSDEEHNLDDSTLDGGFAIDMSPPKTIRFNLNPTQGPSDEETQTQTQMRTPGASRLVQTPAREASRRIVDELLMSAGYKGGGADATDSLSMSELRISTRFDAEEEDEEDGFDIDVGGYGDGRKGGYDVDDSPSVVRVRRDMRDDDEF